MCAHNATMRCLTWLRNSMLAVAFPVSGSILKIMLRLIRLIRMAGTVFNCCARPAANTSAIFFQTAIRLRDYVIALMKML